MNETHVTCQTEEPEAVTDRDRQTFLLFIRPKREAQASGKCKNSTEQIAVAWALLVTLHCRMQYASMSTTAVEPVD